MLQNLCFGAFPSSGMSHICALVLSYLCICAFVLRNQLNSRATVASRERVIIGIIAGRPLSAIFNHFRPFLPFLTIFSGIGQQCWENDSTRSTSMRRESLSILMNLCSYCNGGISYIPNVIYKLFLISLPKRRPNILFNIYTAQAFSEWCVCVLASVGVQADFNTKRQGGAPVWV